MKIFFLGDLRKCAMIFSDSERFRINQKNRIKKMNRITKKQLAARIETINSLLNRPLTPYTKNDDGKIVANIGNFSLSQAYGGYCVHLMVNESGGVSCPIWCGHISASDAYWRLCAFISGLDFKK